MDDVNGPRPDHNHTVTTRSAVFAYGADRYDLLLILLAAVLVLAPFEERASRPVIVALLSASLLFALWTARAHRAVLIAAAGSVGVCVLLSAGAQAANKVPAKAVFAMVCLVLCVATIISIMVRLIPRLSNTARTLAGSLSVYLLFGLGMAYTYAFIGVVNDAGFFAQPGPHDPVSYLYFSFITLTTVGFGDLTANNDGGRMLVVMEALIGQVYLVTVVSIVVGNRVRR